MSINVNGTAYNVSFGAARAVQAAPVSSGSVELKAPVAGTLLKQLVADGANVTEGQTVIMIESMKMELEIKAASAGTVHFLVSPGSAITAGQALAEIK